MSKHRRPLLRGGVIAGLIVLNCFCCLVFRTRFPSSDSVTPLSNTAPIAVLVSSVTVRSISAAQHSAAMVQNLPLPFLQSKKELTSPSLYDMMLENRKDVLDVCPITPTYPKSSSN
jgi:hypothetical protein